jgi:hypothetical protein
MITTYALYAYDVFISYGYGELSHLVPSLRWGVSQPRPGLLPLAALSWGRSQPRLGLGPLDLPHRPTLVFPAHFVITHAHPESTSESVTHPQIAPSQA